MTINRRGFLKAALQAATFVPVMSRFDLAKSSQVEQCWHELEDQPLKIWVGDGGYLEFAGFEDLDPTNRQVFSIRSDGFRTVEELADTICGREPIHRTFEDAYRREVDDQIGDIEEIDFSRLGDVVGDETFLSESRQRIEDWLEEKVDTDRMFDFDHSGSRDCFLFFITLGCDFTDPLGITVIDGDSPGRSYQGAKLTIDIDDANEFCRREHIPLLFAPATYF